MDETISEAAEHLTSEEMDKILKVIQETSHEIKEVWERISQLTEFVNKKEFADDKVLLRLSFPIPFSFLGSAFSPCEHN